METCSVDEGKALDELSVIMNIYAERLTKARSGEKMLDCAHSVANNLFFYFLLFFTFSRNRRLHPLPLWGRLKRNLSDSDGKFIFRHRRYPRARRQSQNQLVTLGSSERRHCRHHNNAIVLPTSLFSPNCATKCFKFIALGMICKTHQTKIKINFPKMW